MNSMSGALKNKVAVVTGGGAGMGRAVAERFAREGAEVVISEIDPERGKETVESICANGGKALFVQTDVGEESDVVSLADTVRTNYGHADVLYNNAAVLYHSQEARAHELSSDIWEKTLRVNLRGLWLCSKYMIPLMLKSGGSIIHVGSPTAVNGSGAGMTAYSVSKGGILALTKVMAVDYARDKLRVNCIIPGVMDTPMNATFLADEAHKSDMVVRIPLGHVGTSDDVSGLAVFLASSESAYCTGGVYMADGGFTAF
jgi:NAD(P)-dependent dehydrogenase (short-subunit alcohol dehydrogenase family)